MEFLALHELLPDSESAFNLFSSLDNELYVSLDGSSKTVLFTSATRGEGRSTIALVYALGFIRAKNKRRVLFVNADQGGTSDNTEKVIGIEINPDTGEAFESYNVVLTKYNELDYVRTFRCKSDKVGLDQSAFEAFIHDMRTKYDLIIVDAAPGIYGNDVLSLAKIVRNVILVVQHRGPKREQVQALSTALERVEANILGTVLNRRKFSLPQWLYGQ